MFSWSKIRSPQVNGDRIAVTNNSVDLLPEKCRMARVTIQNSDRHIGPIAASDNGARKTLLKSPVEVPLAIEKQIATAL